MDTNSLLIRIVLTLSLLFSTPGLCRAWHDETHIAIAKASGYAKWYNAAGPDMAKLKAGDAEAHNHFVNNPAKTTVTPEMILSQVRKYNRTDAYGHLYGAIIASLREYFNAKSEGKYESYHLAYLAHYIGDLSQPLHNTMYSLYNYENHTKTDGIINNDVLEHIGKIRLYPITVSSEQDIAKEVARIANLSIALAKKIESEKRLLTQEEAYAQIGHSASLFKAILQYVKTVKPSKQGQWF